MNFKFLFNNNSIDNRLMQGAHSDEFIKWSNAQQNGDPNAQMSFDDYKAAQIQGSTGTTQTSGQTGAGGPQNTVVTTPTNQGNPGEVQSSGTIKFNGVDTGYRYDKNLSAKQNRRLLKKTLKAKGLGDKADATGLISEYLNQQGGATGKDAAWLAKREGQYGYTTDANGNRDYHKTGNNWGRTLATIAGGLVMGPTGAFIGNLLAKKNTPAGLTKGFYTPTTTQKQGEETESPVDTTTNTGTVGTQPTTEVKTSPTEYSFSGFNGDWGSRAQSVYTANKDNNVWSTMDTDGDGNITQNEMMDYQKSKGLIADGKLGWRTLGAMGLGNQQNDYTWMPVGGLSKFQQGGTVNSQEQALLYATFGMMGYAESQGAEIDFESALTQVIEVSRSQPEALQQIMQNKGLIEAGAKSLQAKDPNLFKQLQQPGTLNKIVSQLSQKVPFKQQKTKKAMKGTKLDYIKELKGICPEGFEITYQAMGGHICPVCKQKKIDEAKCGKKMKKHEGGGQTNGVSNTVKAITKDIQDSKRMTEYKAPDGTVYKNITPEDSAFLSKTVGKWSKNPSVSRNQFKNLSKTDQARVRRLNAKVTESPTQ